MSEKIFREALMQRLDEDPTLVRDVVEQLIKHACRGKVWAIREFINRTDGKAVQPTELTGKDGADLFAGMTTQELRERAKQILGNPDFMRSLQ